MKFKIITLSLAAQLAAFGAIAQTSTTTGTEGMSSTFGGDWTSSLGSAMFGEGGTDVRSADELTSQWATLSEEDRAMIRRDCMAHMQQSGGAADTTGTATDGTAPLGTTDGTGTTGTDTTGTGTGATGADTGTTGTAGTATDGTAGSASDMASADGSAALNVTTEQMEQICAATQGL